MPLIRWNNRAVTAITPHAGNRRVLIPPKKSGGPAPPVTTAARLDNPVQGGKEVLDQGTEVFSGGSGFIPEPGFDVSGTFSHGGAITITGPAVFGTKAQAAPVLWDFGNELYVNGVLNPTHGALADGAAVPVDAGGSQLSAQTGPIFAAVANSAAAGTGPEMIVSDAQRPWRHNRITHHYRLDDYRWFGFCWAQGDSTDSEPWVTGRTYMAARYKLPLLLDKYRRARYTNLSGTFIDGSVPGYADGEDCTLSLSGRPDQPAKVTFVDTVNDIVYLQISGAMDSGNFPGTLTGLTSGATCTLPDNTDYDSAGAVKLTRGPAQGPDGPTKTGNGSVNQPSLNQMFHTMDDNGTVIFESTRGVPYNKGEAQDYPGWFCIETYMDAADTSNGTQSEVWFNNERMGWGNRIVAASRIPVADQDLNRIHQPFINVFGFDRSVSEAIVPCDFGEVYIDYTPQRIMIGDASSKAACTRMEYFRPTAWAADELDAVCNLGEFADLSGLYLYAFSDQNVPILIGRWA